MDTYDILTNIYWKGDLIHCRVKVHHIGGCFLCMQMCIDSLQKTNKKTTNHFQMQVCTAKHLTCTKVVLPEPAIPRHMIQVGLFSIGRDASRVLGSPLGSPPGPPERPSAITATCVGLCKDC